MNAQVYETKRHQTGPFCPAIHFASSHGLLYLSTLSQLLNSPGVDLTAVDSQGSSEISIFMTDTEVTASIHPRGHHYSAFCSVSTYTITRFLLLKIKKELI